MQPRTILIAAALATLTTASGLAAAVDTAQGNHAPAGSTGTDGMDQEHRMMQNDSQGGGMTQQGTMGGRMTERGMMGGGMMPEGMMRGGMMDMMDGCQQMMRSPTTYRLPPGNEKLQMQMQAEMMQKMGEILGRYADKIK